MKQQILSTGLSRSLQESLRPRMQILGVVFPVRLGEGQKNRGFTCPQGVGSISGVQALVGRCSPFNLPNKLGKAAPLRKMEITAVLATLSYWEGSRKQVGKLRHRGVKRPSFHTASPACTTS